jgi:hypothetical protein
MRVTRNDIKQFAMHGFIQERLRAAVNANNHNISSKDSLLETAEPDTVALIASL